VLFPPTKKRKKSNFSEADLNQFTALINQAMQTKEEVMLVYNGGSTPGMARLVKPLRWVHNGRFMFIGMCGRQKTKKNYKMKLVENATALPPIHNQNKVQAEEQYERVQV